MKKYIVTYLSLALLFASCADSFTEKPAIGALSDESLANEAGVELLLVGAYSALDGIRSGAYGADWTSSGDNWWFDVVSDDAHKGSTDGDQADLYELETYNWTASNPYIIGKWGGLFAGINRSNAVISLISTIEGADLSGKLAEARFLRGHYNMELQMIWGNVPYISDENYANTEFNQPNSGAIWDAIEADFQFAADNLPASQAQVGRPTKFTAKAFLGKAYLQQHKYAEALSALEQVIGSGEYSLLSEYGDNFREAGDNSTESLFSIQFVADGGLSYNGNRGGTLNFPSPGPFGSCCGFYQPTQDLANAYQTDAAGLPLLDTFNQSDISNDYGINDSEAFTPEQGNLDPRIDFTVGRRGIDFNGYGVMPGKSWIRATFSDISGPYLPKKNIYHSGETALMGTGGWGEQRAGINFHIMRYSDVLLMAAEAAAETSNLGKALSYVNLVRNRAKGSTYVKNAAGTDAANYVIEPYASFPSKDYAVKAVRFERRLELAMEGKRLFDIRRWGNGTSLINDYITNESRTITNFGGKAGAYQAKHDMFPIPLTAIDLSGGVLQQNPGY